MIAGFPQKGVFRQHTLFGSPAHAGTIRLIQLMVFSPPAHLPIGYHRCSPTREGKTPMSKFSDIAMQAIMGRWAKLCLVPALLALGGCGGGGTPDCGADETLEVVHEIAEENLPSIFSSFGTELISMTGRNAELDSYECSANLTFGGPKHLTEKYGRSKGPITYSVRPSATDNDSFVVEVYGLQLIELEFEANLQRAFGG